MKRLTVDKTWIECLRMWKWIAKEKRTGNKRFPVSLKCEWIQKYGYVIGVMSSNCFFCEYVDTHSNKCGCATCPGTKVDPEFHCENNDYNYSAKPIAFYNKLVALNRKRMRQKKARRAKS